MPTFYERIAEDFKEKLDSLLENSEDFKIDNTDELVKEFDKYSVENNFIKIKL